jgi:uncharacterized protein (DUF2147 family)
MKKNTILLFFSLFLMLQMQAQNKNNDDADKILGKWMSAENDLKVEVFKQNGQYRAKVIWFACEHGIPMQNFQDSNNPNSSLRNRPWLGLQVLDNLHYNGGTEWNNGSIYDPNSGHTFSSVCRLKEYNTLTVRGYWMYEWIGKNLTFYRVNQ